IEVHLDLGGYPVILADTAGFRDTDSKVEAEGIARARRTAENADIKIALFDGTSPAPDASTLALAGDNALMVVSKADLFSAAPAWGRDYIVLSSESAAGVDAL